MQTDLNPAAVWFGAVASVQVEEDYEGEDLDIKTQTQSGRTVAVVNKTDQPVQPGTSSSSSSSSSSVSTHTTSVNVNAKPRPVVIKGSFFIQLFLHNIIMDDIWKYYIWHIHKCHKFL